MRTDFKKVVTERPRAGGGIKTPKGERRQWNRYEEGDEPKREKIRQKWKKSWGEKQFTDVLGPLYGYLRKQVGRPWNKVYSEISKNLPKTSVQNIHIHTHIDQFVEKDVFIINGVPCHNSGFLHGKPLENYRDHQQLYVNPKTGLLCCLKQKKKKKQVDPKIQPGIKVYPGVQYHKVKNIWYEVKVKPDKIDVLNTAFYVADPVLDYQYRNTEEQKAVYGGLYIATSKRPLTKKEISFANLEPRQQMRVA